MKSLSVQESAQKRKEVDSIPLIDVRTPAEFGSVHAEGAVNHPMESLDVERLLFGKEDEIQVICQSGGRSMKVCQKLEAAGYSNVVNVEGGTSAWQASGLPVVEGKRIMSLERQVRIAAGFSVIGTSSKRLWIIGFYRSGVSFCRCDRYLWNGYVDRKDAFLDICYVI